MVRCVCVYTEPDDALTVVIIPFLVFLFALRQVLRVDIVLGGKREPSPGKLCKWTSKGDAAAGCALAPG